LKLHHLTFGEAGSPVVILHGLFGAAKNWTTIAKRLQDEYRVIALDLRNHGQSPWAPSMHLNDMAEDVAKFMAANGLQGAPVVGHSLGGKVAMALALRHSQVVGRLLVSDIAPVAYPRTLSGYVDAMQALNISGEKRRKDLVNDLKKAVEEPGIRAFLLSNLRPSGDGFEWQVNLEAIGNGMADIMGFPASLDDHVYDGATLFVRGQTSDYVRPAHHGGIKKFFPKSKIVTVKGAGHWIHADKPDAFYDILKGFLDWRG